MKETQELLKKDFPINTEEINDHSDTSFVSVVPHSQLKLQGVNVSLFESLAPSPLVNFSPAFFVPLMSKVFSSTSVDSKMQSKSFNYHQQANVFSFAPERVHMNNTQSASCHNIDFIV